VNWQAAATIIILGGWALYWIMDQIEVRRGVGASSWSFRADHYDDYDDCSYYDNEQDPYYSMSYNWDWPSVNGWSADHPSPIVALAVPRSATLHSVHVKHYDEFPF
jgi:hypothetical protein